MVNLHNGTVISTLLKKKKALESTCPFGRPGHQTLASQREQLLGLAGGQAFGGQWSVASSARSFRGACGAGFPHWSGPSSQETMSVGLMFRPSGPSSPRRGPGWALTGSVEGTATSLWPHQGALGHRAEEQGAKFGWRSWRGTTTNKERRNRSFAKLVFLWIFYFFIIHPSQATLLIISCLKSKMPGSR